MGEFRKPLRNESSLSFEPFGQLADGRNIQRYTLRSDSLEAAIVPYGGRIVSLRVPDRDGAWDEITLGFDSLERYTADNPYFGASIGRYANRIAAGRFQLEGRSHALVRNDGDQCLHGGEGFDHRVWEAQLDGGALIMSYCSPDGEAGFPGDMLVRISFSVVGSALRIDYEATSDRPTFVNLTNHTYFNLAGADKPGSNVLGHRLLIMADHYLPVDASLVPLPGIGRVDNTPFDFRIPCEIGTRIGQDHEQLVAGRGYDHCWALERTTSAGLELAARVHDPASGRVMEVLTTEPGLQFYSGNFLDGTQLGRAGVAYTRYAGLCLETQHFPDTPNRPDFPPALLLPGRIHRSSTVYRFSVDTHVSSKEAKA
jgi:aldose 1-epimerase